MTESTQCSHYLLGTNIRLANKYREDNKIITLDYI